ncbi:MAG: hypothetical protein HYY63_04965 [Elusimicrobia bacterium]|nr:hypothetical protein [Elusimicrobiota bacterium]
MTLFYAILGVTLTLLQETKPPDKNKRSNLGKGAAGYPSLRAGVSPQIPIPLLYVSVAGFVVSSIYYFNWRPYTKNKLGLEAATTQGNSYSRGIDLFRQALNTDSFTNFEVRIELVKAILLNLQNPSLTLQDKKEGLLLALSESNKNIQDHPLELKSYLASSLLCRTVHKLDTSYLDQAENLMQKALTLAPKRPEVYWELSDIYHLKNNEQKAVEWRIKADLLSRR